jgi:hypothetical protein
MSDLTIGRAYPTNHRSVPVYAADFDRTLNERIGKAPTPTPEERIAIALERIAAALERRNREAK